MGVDRPGDMEALTSWIKPTIAVITTLAEIPVHVEYFPSPEAVAREKAKILRHLSAENFAVLNMDDAAVYAMREKTRAKITTYGFAESADISGSNYKIMTRDEGDFRIPEGITFKVDHKGSSVPVRIFGSLGRHHVYPALAASAVGIAVGMNFVDISEALARYVSPPGRMKPVRGIKNTLILDDTYNSSPMAVRAALEVLAEIPANRKIAVLGDMLELGKYTIEAHRGLASVLKKTADFVISVGPRAKFITTELREKGFAKKRLFEFSTSDEVKTAIQDILEEGDLVLVKGSQGMRMEKIVEEIMAEPQKACELLVRQEKRWRCKK
jgi:UDP-N-acetylmuramoyl-tripeptide--D-alanyl-D-alanine ligase